MCMADKEETLSVERINRLAELLVTIPLGCKYSVIIGSSQF